MLLVKLAEMGDSGAIYYVCTHANCDASAHVGCCVRVFVRMLATDKHQSTESFTAVKIAT